MAKTAKKKQVVSARRKVKSSTTRSRKVVKHTSTKQASPKQTVHPKIQRFAEQPVEGQKEAIQITVQAEQPKAQQEVAPPAEQQPEAESSAKQQVAEQGSSVRQQAAKLPTEQQVAQVAQKIMHEQKTVPPKKPSRYKVHFGFKRVILALACAAAAVFAIVYFVDLNTPNVSLRVAAMQSGIDATYPAYVPRDFSLSDITSESGKITLNFRNASTGDAFTIIEEKSSWDSNALAANYVKDTYGDDYTQISEQGLTLFISGSDACWVNGGIVYKLKTTSGSLTKKQIKAIAVSL